MESTIGSTVGSNAGFGFPAIHGGLERWTRLLAHARSAFQAIAARHAQARKARATVDELSCLSARQLADIGLTRADVDFMDARNGRSLFL